MTTATKSGHGSAGRGPAVLAGANVLLLAAHLGTWAWQGGALRALPFVGRQAAEPPAVPQEVAAAPPRPEATVAAALAAAALPAATIETAAAAAPEAASEVAPHAAHALPAAAYTVHAGSFRSERNAGLEVARLAREGFEARSVPVDLGSKGRWFRVYVGSWATRAEALAARDALVANPEWPYAFVLRVAGDRTAVQAPSRPSGPPAVATAAPATAPAAAVVTAATAPDPDVVSAAQRYYEFGLAEEGRGQSAEAAEAFARAVQLQPDLHAARNHLATMHLALGRVVEAAGEIAQLENVLADDPRWLLNRALLAYRRQNWLDAHVVLVRLLAHEPGDLQARLLLGNVFEAMNDPERALFEYRDASRIAPGEPAALYQLARGLDAVGRRDEAVEAYEQFLERAGRDVAWAEVLGAVKQRLEWLKRS